MRSAELRTDATSRRIGTAIAPHAVALVPGLLVVAVLIVWAVHNGGYDADTWYWGALALLGLLAVTVVALGPRLRVSRRAGIALALFGLYVAWSYLSITWAESPGDALQGSNRALLYLIVFALLVVLPWTPQGAFVALITFTLGIGTIAVVILFRLAASDRIGSLVIDGRLAAPTGYFNASAALFTMAALVGTVLASRREFPGVLGGVLRGLLIALATACLQLAVVGQSRGWLFTLPLVLLLAIVAVPDRLRVAAAAALPILGAVAPVHKLVSVFDNPQPAALHHAASQAGRVSLLICAAVFVAGTLIAWGDLLARIPAPSRRTQRRIGVGVVVTALAVAIIGGFAATHGDPGGFINRQWNGFSHPVESGSGGSHFGTVGSGRYDFWRVSLDALADHPIGGLGQDNFDDYYVTRRHSSEEPSWTHSLEMRLLAHTGLVGFGLFVGFIVVAMMAAVRAVRRSGTFGAAMAATCLLPLFVWLLHGSVDWFWEIPALSGPALGFLGVAIGLGTTAEAEEAAAVAEVAGDGPGHAGGRRLPRVPRPVWGLAGYLGLLAAAFALGLPYLAVREISTASDLRSSDTTRALSDLSNAARLNPLSADPGRLGGTIALEAGLFNEAEKRFSQAISRQRGGWYAWFGDGLAASSLGDNVRAARDFAVAGRINDTQPAIKLALRLVNTTHPLKPQDALQMLVIAK